MTLGDRQKVLFLSVGGSDQPLRSSLRESRPDLVIFVVSDGSDGSESSRKAAEALYQAKGCPERREILSIPPDDPDDALAKIEPVLSRLVANGADVTVDYTGGTKSMTSAMVLAATSLESVKLQFMVGKRHNLNQIKAGTEKPLEIPTKLIGLSHTFRTIRAFIGRRNYGAALTILREINGTFNRHSKVPRAWRRKVGDWAKWVEIFDEWDRFNHAEAWRKLQNGLKGGARHATWFEVKGAAYRLRLESLYKADKLPSYELVEDLWLNAERKAELGMFDDAVARLYRLTEAVVQARLLIEHHINTAEVPIDRLPSNLLRKHRPEDHSTSVGLPLQDSIELLKSIDPNDRLPKTMDPRPEWQPIRNNSILAHGFRPLSQSDWNTAKTWFQQRSDTLWKAGLGRSTSDQLPNQLPDF